MELNTNGINTNTVSITDYKIVATKLAKVIVAFTGSYNKDSITASIASQLKHLAVPVENSFRFIKDNVAVGYVRANTEVRNIEKNELRANYKVMSSNIMMDNSDKTLWEVKEGAGGKFLARHGNEDLSELVNAATNHRMGVPRLAQLATASAAPKEFVAFASASGDMDYGFCVASKEGRVQVVAASTGTAVTIPVDAIVSVVPASGAQIPLSAHKRITAAGITRDDRDSMISYYTRLYSYSPSYLAEYIDAINTIAVV